MSDRSPLSAQLVGLGFDVDLGPRLRRVDGGADVVVVRAWPDRLAPGVAVLAVDAEGDVRRRADHAVTSEQLRTDASAAVWRAWAARRVHRPLAEDSDVDWLEALRLTLGAREARLVRRGGPSDPPSHDLLTEVAHGDRLVAWVGADRVAADLGLAGADVALAVAGMDREPAWVVAAGLGGADWAEAALPLLRAAADARDRVVLLERLAEARTASQRHDQLVRKLLAVLTHDLRNVLFPIQLGLKVLERQVGATKQVLALYRSVANGSDLVRRLSDATWVFGGEPPARSPSVSSDVADVCRAALRYVAGRFPGRAIEVVGDLPSLQVPFAQSVLEGILTTLLTNALQHGPPDRPVQLSGRAEDESAWITVLNGGHLPFSDLNQLGPFQHRARGGLGLGLYVANRLAQAQGMDLQVREVDGEVQSTLHIPARPAIPAAAAIPAVAIE